MRGVRTFGVPGAATDGFGAGVTAMSLSLVSIRASASAGCGNGTAGAAVACCTTGVPADSTTEGPSLERNRAVAPPAARITAAPHESSVPRREPAPRSAVGRGSGPASTMARTSCSETPASSLRAAAKYSCSDRCDLSMTLRFRVDQIWGARRRRSAHCTVVCRFSFERPVDRAKQTRQLLSCT